MTDGRAGGQGVVLGDFTALAETCRETGGGLNEFLDTALVAALAWPNDVVEQWVFDHSGHGPFLADYGELDLTGLTWSLERLSSQLLSSLGTGPSDGDAIEQYAADPDFWLNKRKQVIVDAWQAHGTWLRAPLLIDRAVLTPQGHGLQVIEGRTRVGLLRERLRLGQKVAAHHEAWVARCQYL